MIKKVRLTTTLAKLREYFPCASSWATLLKSLPADYPDAKPINLLHILKSNGVQDVMWALRAATPDLPKLRVAMCADMAARVLKYYEAEYPDDKRPRDCIKTCRQYVRGKITVETLEKASHAAAHAAYAACAHAAPYAAFHLASAADAAHATTASARAAAHAAPYAAHAAHASARAAYVERKAQAIIIRKYLK